MKTIFFVLASKTNTRDLLLIPGGVFDILRNDEKLRIVIVIPKGLYRKFAEYFENMKFSDRVVLEVINAPAPSTYIQKLFMFFTKYLILTSTMKLLATAGVRTDTPPAGGKPYLYFLKQLNYWIFGRSKWIKDFLVPKLFYVIFKDRPYKILFDKYQPDLFFSADIKPFFSLSLLAEAKKRGVKTIQMPGNWDHFKYYFPLQSDIMLVDNEPLKEEATGCENYRNENVFTVGFPKFDFFLDQKNILSRKEFLDKIGFKPDAKIVLFVSEGVYSLDGGDIVEMTIDWINSGALKKNTRIILRPYPPYPGHFGEGEKYGKFEKHLLVRIDALDSWRSLANLKNFINLLYHADIIITTYSTVAIEAMVFEKPIINIGFDGYKERPMYQSVKRFIRLSHFKHITDTGGLRTVKSKEEFFVDLSQYLNFPDKNAEKREGMKERMCYKLDGKSSKRIADCILNYLYNRR